MSNVRFVFPKPRLNELLRAPGGVPVAEALARCEANLDAIKPSCMAELLALLELSEARLAAMGAELDDEGMGDLYSIAVRGIGAGKVCGVPAVDDALVSLCDLLDFLRTQARYDRDAIAVHSRAWRLLSTPNLPAAASAEILSGLMKVSRKFAAPAPPPAP